MSVLSKIFGFFTGGAGSSLIDKGLEIALEKTEDVDKRNALVMSWVSMREETHRAALNRVTIPWVDALHKIARPILAALAIVCVCVLVGVVVVTGSINELMEASELIFSALGIGGIYTVLKGRGR